MTFEEYYGEGLLRLKQVEVFLLHLVYQYPAQEDPDGVGPVLYCKSRIKQPDSMMRKLRMHGLPTDGKTALEQMHDAVGIRVVCAFVEDVYRVSQWLGMRPEYEIAATKDYIAYPKPNGYRSLHLVLRFHTGLQAEIQLRTIALDFWAALEHQMKYKKNIAHEKTICDELKRCADEIASVDMFMQTLRELIRYEGWED